MIKIQSNNNHSIKPLINISKNYSLQKTMTNKPLQNNKPSTVKPKAGDCHDDTNNISVYSGTEESEVESTETTQEEKNVKKQTTDLLNALSHIKTHTKTYKNEEDPITKLIKNHLLANSIKIKTYDVKSKDDKFKDAEFKDTTFKEHKGWLIDKLEANKIFPSEKRTLSILMTLGRLTNLYTYNIETLINDGDKDEDFYKKLSELKDLQEYLNSSEGFESQKIRDLASKLNKALEDNDNLVAFIFYFIKEGGHYAEYLKTEADFTNVGTRFQSRIKNLPNHIELDKIKNGSSFSSNYLATNREKILESCLTYIQNNTLDKDKLDQIKKLCNKVLDMAYTSEIAEKRDKDTSTSDTTRKREIKSGLTKTATQSLIKHDYKSRQNNLAGSGGSSESNLSGAKHDLECQHKEELNLIEFYWSCQQQGFSQNNKDLGNNLYREKAKLLKLGDVCGLNKMQSDFINKLSTETKDVKFTSLGSDTGSGKSSIVSDQLFPLIINPHISKKDNKTQDSGLKNFAQKLFQVVKNIKDTNPTKAKQTLQKVINLGKSKEPDEKINDNFYNKLINANNADDVTDALKNCINFNTQGGRATQGGCAINIQPTLFINYHRNYKIISLKTTDYRDKNGAFSIKDLISKLQNELEDNKKAISLTIDEAHLMEEGAKEKLKKILKEYESKNHFKATNVILVSATLNTNSVKRVNGDSIIENKVKSEDREKLLQKLKNSLLKNTTQNFVNSNKTNHATKPQQDSVRKYSTRKDSTVNSTVNHAKSPHQTNAPKTKESPLQKKIVYTPKAEQATHIDPSPATSSTHSFVGGDKGKGTVVYNGALKSNDFSLGIDCNGVILGDGIKSSIEYCSQIAELKNVELFIFKEKKGKGFIVFDRNSKILNKADKNGKANASIATEEDYLFTEKGLKDKICQQNFVYFSPTAEDHNPPFAVKKEGNPYDKAIAILPEEYLDSEDTIKTNSLFYQTLGRLRKDTAELAIFTFSKAKELKNASEKAIEITDAELLYRQNVGNFLSNASDKPESKENTKSSDHYSKIYNRFTKTFKNKHKKYRDEEPGFAMKFLLANIYFNSKKNAEEYRKDNFIESAKLFSKDKKEKFRNLFLNTKAHYEAIPETLKPNEAIHSGHLDILEQLLKIAFITKFAQVARKKNAILQIESSSIEFIIEEGELFLSYGDFKEKFSDLTKGELAKIFEKFSKNEIFTKDPENNIQDIENLLKSNRDDLKNILKTLSIELETTNTVQIDESKNYQEANLPQSQYPDSIEAIKNHTKNLLDSLLKVVNNLIEHKSRSQSTEISLNSSNLIVQKEDSENSTEHLTKQLEKTRQKLKETEQKLRETGICKTLQIPDGLTFKDFGYFIINNWEAVYGNDLEKEKQVFEKSCEDIARYIEKDDIDNYDSTTVTIKKEIGFFCTKCLKDKPDISLGTLERISLEDLSFGEDGMILPTITNLIYCKKQRPLTTISRQTTEIKIQNISQH